MVGTDSHTTMVNGLSVLGWGVGGIEAEAAMLGQPIPMLIPEVIGFRLTGELPEGATATDLVLTVTQMLRKKGVVGKFVEYFGDGLGSLTIEDQATIANMAPEYGATCGFFPVTQVDHRLPHRHRPRSGAGRPGRGLRQGAGPVASRKARPSRCSPTPWSWTSASVLPSIAGPKRPQDRVLLSDAAAKFAEALTGEFGKTGEEARASPVAGESFDVGDGDVVIAAITSCTNTSNPSVLIAAGLVAKKAVEKGLKTKPWVKTSLAPGSQVVTDYLAKAGLTEAARRPRLQPGGLRLHHLHRQLRPAAAGDLRSDPGRRPGGRQRCCPATATSRAGSIRTCAPTTWPRRRWWSPTPWPAR